MTRNEQAQKAVAVAWKAASHGNRRAESLIDSARKSLYELSPSAYWQARQSLGAAKALLVNGQDEESCRMLRRAFLEVMLTER